MNRSGYNEDCDYDWQHIMWRGQVASAIRGKRGQAFLREMLEALDAMPEKRLIAHDLQVGGDVCALGSVGVRRGIELKALDPEDHYALASTFGIARQLVQEIEYMNDEGVWKDDAEKRWQFVRNWIVENLRDKNTDPRNYEDQVRVSGGMRP